MTDLYLDTKNNNNMKLGVSYNVFDGEELLEKSILCIRKKVDFICIVYQSVSNYGEERSVLRPFLADLKHRGLIDSVFHYTPKESGNRLVGEQNEITKRNIGMNICRANDCTHHISMDCDEMYDEQEFENAKMFVSENNIDTSYVSYINYYKKPNLVLTNERNGIYGYVSFIVKIDTRFYGYGESAVLVDPTRRVEPSKYHIFNRDEITMHHYSYIRKDEESLRRKLNNTSYRQHHLMIDSIDDIVDCYLTHKGEEDVLLPFPTGYQVWNLKLVEDKLNILKDDKK